MGSDRVGDRCQRQRKCCLPVPVTMSPGTGVSAQYLGSPSQPLMRSQGPQPRPTQGSLSAVHSIFPHSAFRGSSWRGSAGVVGAEAMRAAWRAERVRMENGMCMVDVDCNFIRQDRELGSD